VFQCASSISLDAKGRISIPARHRDALLLQCEGRLTLTRHPLDECLQLFPRPVWEILSEKIAAWPMSARSEQRILLAHAQPVEIDASGRILISPELRLAAGLKREVMMLGMGSRFEIWDTERYAESEAKAKAAGISDVLLNFSF